MLARILTGQFMLELYRGDEEGKRIDVNVRMFDWRRDKLEGEDR